MPIQIARERLEGVQPFLSMPQSEDHFLGRVGQIAAFLEVGPDQIKNSLSYLEAIQPDPEQSGRRDALLKTMAARFALLGPNQEDQDTIVAPQLYLSEKLAKFNLHIAEEGVEVAELCSRARPRLCELMGVYINPVRLEANAIGHDDGKMATDPEVTKASQEGVPWTRPLVEAMADHSPWGFILSIAAGQQMTVARTKYANHAKQRGWRYGSEAHLTNEERILRDLGYAYDGQLACLTRTNDRNRSMDTNARLLVARECTAEIFDDYHHVSDENNPKRIAAAVSDIGEVYILDNYAFLKDEHGFLHPIRKEDIINEAA